MNDLINMWRKFMRAWRNNQKNTFVTDSDNEALMLKPTFYDFMAWCDENQDL